MFIQLGDGKKFVSFKRVIEDWLLLNIVDLNIPYDTNSIRGDINKLNDVLLFTSKHGIQSFKHWIEEALKYADNIERIVGYGKGYSMENMEDDKC